jgi:hypothetical protein
MATTQLKPPGNIYGVTANQPKPLSAHELHMNHLAQIGATQQQISQANNYNKAQNNKGNPVIPAPTNTGVVNPTQSTYNAPSPFQFNYDYLNYDTAKQRAEDRYNPLFQQAVDGVKAQQYQNNLDSGQSAAVRGLAHSGLAQDALTKIAIASQGQIAGLNAQKMSNVADYAQGLLDKDQARGDALRSQMFNEYNANRTFDRGNFESDRSYGLEKNAQDFNQMNTNRYYNLDTNKNNFDQMNTNRYYNLDVNKNNFDQMDRNRSANLDASKFKSDEYWRNQEWNTMSPAEKMKMAAELANSMKLKKDSGGGGGGGNSSSSPSTSGLTQKGSQNLNIDPNILMAYYNSMLNSKAGNANVPYSRDPNSAYMRKMQDIANG